MPCQTLEDLASQISPLTHYIGCFISLAIEFSGFALNLTFFPILYWVYFIG